MKQHTHTDKFMTGQTSQSDTSEPVDKFTNRSRMKKGGGMVDPLRDALAHRQPTLPSGQTPFKHSKASRPTGTHYSPGGSFGKMERSGAGRGVYGYGPNKHSATPSNAVGSPPNRIGANALASAFTPRAHQGHIR